MTPICNTKIIIRITRYTLSDIPGGLSGILLPVLMNGGNGGYINRQFGGGLFVSDFHLH